MSIAILSDIHANLEALEAVLEDVRRHDGIEAVACLGDIVGYGPDPGACVDLVLDACDVVIAGNHDYAVVGILETTHFNRMARSVVDWTRSALTSAQRKSLAGLAVEATLNDVLLVHASPASPSQYPYVRDLAGAAAMFSSREFTLAVYGHTHIPIAFHFDGTTIATSNLHRVSLAAPGSYLANVGSVGQPRDEDPRACYAVVDREARTLTWRRVAYDAETTAAKIASAGLPSQLGQRLLVGL